jgi:hypothetical protein
MRPNVAIYFNQQDFISLLKFAQLVGKRQYLEHIFHFHAERFLHYRFNIAIPLLEQPSQPCKPPHSMQTLVKTSQSKEI